MSRKLLLISGILASALYVGTDIIAAISWEDYSYIDQSVSELRAINAPTRPFLVPTLFVYALLEIAFGLGVLKTAGQKRPLRTAGVLLVGLGIVDLAAYFTPMHLRGAETTLTDTMHVILTALTVLMILLIIGFGSSADGRRFRIYSIATILTLLASGAWAFMDAPRIAANLPTPWIGVRERVNIYGYMLWMLVLAVALLSKRDSPENREQERVTPVISAASVVKFLDMQAMVGVSKHMGGFEAMDELLSLCHIENAGEVLDAGCGIGVGPAYLARKFKCRVVGTDISEKMIEWSKQRAREEGVEDKTEFFTADIRKLPFEDNRFDAVICQSVLAFVEDKQQAIREFARVTRPGGYIGLNEGFWISQPPPEILEQIKTALGPSILTLEAWQTLWESTGMDERVVRVHQIDARAEIKSRLQWIGWRWILRAWGRALRLVLTDPSIRESIKKQLDVPPESFQYFGYGLFVGRKQGAPGLQ